jgi:signal transduction histidine kinase
MIRRRRPGPFNLGGLSSPSVPSRTANRAVTRSPNQLQFGARRRFAGGLSFQVEYQYTNALSEQLDISLTISPVKDARGNITGASKIARDITEHVRTREALRKANERLAQSNANLEYFAYSAAHDLQEPLRMVSAYREMLRRKYGNKLGNICVT